MDSVDVTAPPRSAWARLDKGQYGTAVPALYAALRSAVLFTCGRCETFDGGHTCYGPRACPVHGWIETLKRGLRP